MTWEADPNLSGGVSYTPEITPEIQEIIDTIRQFAADCCLTFEEAFTLYPSLSDKGFWGKLDWIEKIKRWTQKGCPVSTLCLLILYGSDLDATEDQFALFDEWYWHPPAIMANLEAHKKG